MVDDSRHFLLPLHTGPSFKTGKKKKGLTVNSEQVVHEYIEDLCPLLVLAAQKYFESLLRKHQRVSEGDRPSTSRGYCRCIEYLGYCVL